ncbi:hypothetical protein [Streptomyces sp. URMC 124]|uniref:hypothetical protein n=1 Tax=Streptomyces sp. URMC 124 TaxID=3423405 RepID=UPI003F19AA6E
MTRDPERRIPRISRFPGFRRFPGVPRAAAATLLAVAAVSVDTAPAAAQGAMAISAPGRPVRAGQALRISGGGDDDAARYLRACVQERALGATAWRTAGCGRTVSPGSGATVEASVRARRRGALQLRGVLYGLDAPGDPHPDVVRSSPVRMVRIH